MGCEIPHLGTCLCCHHEHGLCVKRRLFFGAIFVLVGQPQLNRSGWLISAIFVLIGLLELYGLPRREMWRSAKKKIDTPHLLGTHVRYLRLLFILQYEDMRMAASKHSPIADTIGMLHTLLASIGKTRQSAFLHPYSFFKVQCLLPSPFSFFKVLYLDCRGSL